MAQKIQVTLDASKLRTLVSSRSYKNKEGQDVTVQEVKFDLIEMKEESKKSVYEHDKFSLIKTHFAVARQTKEEREQNAPAVYIGEGISQVWKNDNEVHNAVPLETPPIPEGDDLPF